MSKSSEVRESFDDILSSSSSHMGSSLKSGQKPSVREVASRGRETFFGSWWRTAASSVGIMGLWGFLSYHKELVPSPTVTVNTAIDGVQWVVAVPDKLWGEDDNSGNKNASTVTTQPAVSNETTSTAALATAGNPTNLVPVISQAPAVAATTLAISSTTLGLQEHLPAVVEYSAAAGSVMCNGEEKAIHIDTVSGVPPLTQMTDQTGEPWNQGQPNSNADTILYQEASQGKTDFYVRLGCVGLEN